MATPQIRSTGRQHRHGGRRRVHKLLPIGSTAPVAARPITDTDRLAYDPTTHVPATPKGLGAIVTYSSGDARTGNRWGPGNLPVGRFASAMDRDPCDRRKTRNKRRAILWRNDNGIVNTSAITAAAPLSITEPEKFRLEIAYRDTE